MCDQLKRVHWTLLEPDAMDEEMLGMDDEGFVEVAPERLAPSHGDTPNETAIPTGATIGLDDGNRITVEEMVRRTDRPAWMVARGLANLIEKGLLKVEDGTPIQAATSLRRLAASYRERI